MSKLFLTKPLAQLMAESKSDQGLRKSLTAFNLTTLGIGAVIGAGIAGLSCATALQNAGHVVQVFDKSRGVSGRMSTRKGDGWQADHGAPYFDAHDRQFRAEVERWCNAGAAECWQPRLRVLKDGVWQDGDVHTDQFVGTPSMTSSCCWIRAPTRWTRCLSLPWWPSNRNK